MTTASGGGGFEAATGDGPPVAPADAEQRSREVRTALDGLLRIRSLTRPQGAGPKAAPAEWERRQPVRAVALALESGGITPSSTDSSGERTGTGYRVRAGDRPETVLVEWLGPPGSGAARTETEALGACVPVLARLGWEALLYRGPRGRRFLEVEPAGD
ncbi:MULTISPECIES: hypothetical protein [unclassified Streptomyces]|uniref:hypothetical protein n=1 Tax=unclassified Streptomyces TaxID=2593676 RepID=UPI001660B3C3|nr:MULTISPECIES: hypothetical protein [unclassified Streptomyces]MBD0708229.1 hypothetical protein [Streptomyces sp. CBMA291]MBD0717798.1 hypothetical protein [Streptomyces sp. CBMA370]